MSIQSHQIPPVPRELVLKLRQAFPGPRIERNKTIDVQQVAWDTAQAEVVKWIERYAQNGYVSGDPADIERAEEIKHPTPWWRRLFRWRK